MTSRVCRWGILGTANIARKNWQAIKLAGNSQLVAVASRTGERAAQFIAECQAHVAHSPAPEPCASYAELLAREDIDAVYIPLPTGIRPEWVIRAAEAKKHVLCEKPCGTTAADMRAMLDACQKNNVQFMDGVMFMHSGRLPQLRAALDDGQSIGKLRRIASQFSFQAPEEFLKGNIRVSSELEPLGCLGDLGWYNTRFALWVMNYQMPHRVSGRMLSQHGRSDSAAPVPLEFSAELFFADGISASFYCSFITENQQWANISGTKGFIHLRDFVLPYFGGEAGFDVTNAVFETHGCDFNMCDHTRRVAVPEYSAGYLNAQEVHLFRNFANIVNSGKLEPKWGEIALKTQQVLDACLESARADGKLVACG